MSSRAYTREQACRIYLAGAPGMTPRIYYILLSAYGTGEAAFDALRQDGRIPGLTAEFCRKMRERCRQERMDAWMEDLDRSGITCVCRGDGDYPTLLEEIFDPPAVLYCLGEGPLELPRSVAVVGTRRGTQHGEQSARMVARDLAAGGVAVVSGMARGIDGQAHEGALERGGVTVAVLGSGVDVPYPPEHTGLYRRILDHGGRIISEFPPGTPPYKNNFPQRNRIISGLCPAALVVEAGSRSGALITANSAADQGREVFVLPGSIANPAAAGSNELIASGATLVFSAQDILDEMGWEGGLARAQDIPAAQPPVLSPDEQRLCQCLENQPLGLVELALRTDLPVPRLNSLLTSLELKGIIKQLPGNLFCKEI